MRKPLTDIWGNGNGEPHKETNCKNHPDRIGFVDLGLDAENRYPCYECYSQICLDRGNMVKSKGAKSGSSKNEDAL